jgi:hypothetical protein
MITIAGVDRDALIEEILDGWGSDYLHKYFSFYSDQYSLMPGVPEIVLYPLDGIRPEFTHSPAAGILDSDASTYVPYNISSVTSGMASESVKFKTYITNLTSSAGYTIEGRTLRAQIDKTTGFFVDPTIYTGDRNNLLPPEKLSEMGSSFPELRFTRATLQPPPGVGAARRRTFRRTRLAKLV